MAASNSPAVEGDKSSVLNFIGLQIKPFTKHNIIYYYVPIHGAISYTSLSINVMNPSLVVRLFPKRDVTNFLLFSALIGSGLYLYDRPHLSGAPLCVRGGYSVFGAVMFSFGSVLIWAVMRSILPENIALCTVVGVASGIGLIKAGTNYVNYVDSQIKFATSRN